MILAYNLLFVKKNFTFLISVRLASPCHPIYLVWNRTHDLIILILIGVVFYLSATYVEDLSGVDGRHMPKWRWSFQHRWNRPIMKMIFRRVVQESLDLSGIDYMNLNKKYMESKQNCSKIIFTDFCLSKKKFFLYFFSNYCFGPKQDSIP